MIAHVAGVDKQNFTKCAYHLKKEWMRMDVFERALILLYTKRLEQLGLTADIIVTKKDEKEFQAVEPH